MNEQKMIELRQKDTWEEVFPQDAEKELFDCVSEMEKNSEWIPGIKAKNIRLEFLDPRPMFIEKQLLLFHMDDAESEKLAQDTANHGTKLLIDIGTVSTQNGRSVQLVRDTASDGLRRVAKLSGYALNRMSPDKYVECMNNAFHVAAGSALALIRYGKLSGLQSGAESGYMVMPISKLLDISVDTATRRFGQAEFASGYNSHGFTSAKWNLPDAQNELCAKYQNALKKTESKYAIDFMPGVEFHSSDTADSAATLDPVFYHNGTPLRLTTGVRVKHIRRNKTKNRDGIDFFAEEAGKIFAKFEDATKAVEKLAKIRIQNPINCCIGLCNRYTIGPKYGQAAIEEIERIAAGELSISAHDLFIAMSEILAEAERQDASLSVRTKLDESLTKIVHTDFSDYDVLGTVAWKSSGAGTD